MSPEQILDAWLSTGRSHAAFRSFHYDFARAIEQAAAREAVERVEALKRDHITGSSGCTNANCDFIAAWDDAIRALLRADTGGKE